MLNSQIIEIYNRLEIDSEIRELNEKKYKKEYEEFIKCADAMSEKCKDIEGFVELANNLDMAQYDLYLAMIKDVFRRAFIVGARVGMEICGVECKEVEGFNP